MDDVVVLSVVLEEVKNKNIGIYNRLRALCSSSSRNFFVFSNQHHRCSHSCFYLLYRMEYFLMFPLDLISNSYWYSCCTLY